MRAGLRQFVMVHANSCESSLEMITPRCASRLAQKERKKVLNLKSKVVIWRLEGCLAESCE